VLTPTACYADARNAAKPAAGPGWTGFRTRPWAVLQKVFYQQSFAI